MKGISQTLFVSSFMALFIYPPGFTIWGAMIFISLTLGALCKLEGRDSQ